MPQNLPEPPDGGNGLTANVGNLLPHVPTLPFDGRTSCVLFENAGWADFIRAVARSRAIREGAPVVRLHRDRAA